MLNLRLNAFCSPRNNAHCGQNCHCDRSLSRLFLHLFLRWSLFFLLHDMYCCMLGLVGTQGPVSSVLIQKHSSEQATSGAPPSRHLYGPRAPPTRTTSTRTSRGPTVQTIHTTPVKVVH